MDAITVSGLTKRYGDIEALCGVDHTVPRGAVYGLLGPNGAGKSTLIKALVGSLRPSGGDVFVLGLDPLRQRAALRERIGYMPQGPALYEDLSARENVWFFGAAHNVPDLAGRAEEVLEFTDLRARADDPVRTFSGGMQRRVSLACALVHQPDVLFLDEPTAAVDPGLRARFWSTFRGLAQKGVTLFVSTHLMDEALLCDEVAVLRQGQVITADAQPESSNAGGRTCSCGGTAGLRSGWSADTPKISRMPSTCTGFQGKSVRLRSEATRLRPSYSDSSRRRNNEANADHSWAGGTAAVA